MKGQINRAGLTRLVHTACLETSGNELWSAAMAVAFVKAFLEGRRYRVVGTPALPPRGGWLYGVKLGAACVLDACPRRPEKGTGGRCSFHSGWIHDA
jgi:hypothetical protein